MRSDIRRSSLSRPHRYHCAGPHLQHRERYDETDLNLRWSYAVAWMCVPLLTAAVYHEAGVVNAVITATCCVLLLGGASLLRAAGRDAR